MKFPLVPEESYEKRLDWEMGEIQLKGSSNGPQKPKHCWESQHKTNS